MEGVKNISIHSLPKEGDSPLVTAEKFGKSISIHSLPKEGDNAIVYNNGQLLIFQSTPSPRRETGSPSCPRNIYINFNPLPPQGGRPNDTCYPAHIRRFQSTPSPRRETGGTYYVIFRIQNFNPLPPQGGRHSRCC